MRRADRRRVRVGLFRGCLTPIGAMALAGCASVAAAPPSAVPGAAPPSAVPVAATPQGRESVDVVEVRPDPDWRLRTLDGEVFRLGDLRGRPVFVNLWATWCPPCVAELASIGRLADRVGDAVAFVLVTHEDERLLREFMQRHAVPIEPVLEETLAPESLGAAALPHTVVIGPEGRLRMRHRGATMWDTPEMASWLAALAANGGGA